MEGVFDHVRVVGVVSPSYIGASTIYSTGSQHRKWQGVWFW